MADATVLFEAGQAGPPFLEQTGISCEFKVIHHVLSIKFHFFYHSMYETCRSSALVQAYPGLGHSISNAELKYLESWIKTRLPSSS
jgi:lysophospholipase-2